MREKYIDIMKGIAMLAIMSVHLPKEYMIVKYGLSFMVPIFFVISGFFISSFKGESIKGWYRKKGKRLLFAYFGFSIWSIVIWIFVSFFNKTFRISSLFSLIYQSISGLGILTLWFLPALIIGEIIIVFLYGTSFVKRQIIINIVTILVLYVSYRLSLKKLFGQAYYDYSTPIQMILINISIVICQGTLAAFFINLGDLIRPFLKKLKEMKIELLLFSGIILEVLQFAISKTVIADMHYMNMITPVKFICVAILGILGIICISIALEKVNIGYVLEFIGKKSLFIMGTHHNFMLTNLVTYIMTWGEFNSIEPNILRSICAFVILLVLEMVLLLVCEKLGLIQYILFSKRGGKR